MKYFLIPLLLVFPIYSLIAQLSVSDEVTFDSQLYYLHSYQYPKSAYKASYYDELSKKSSINEQPDYPSPDDTGLVSVSVYQDDKGIIRYINIPNEDYELLGTEGGEQAIHSGEDAKNQILVWQRK